MFDSQRKCGYIGLQLLFSQKNFNFKFFSPKPKTDVKSSENSYLLPLPAGMVTMLTLLFAVSPPQQADSPFYRASVILTTQ